MEFRCKVCSIALSGVVPLQQHLQSSKHLKKVSAMEQMSGTKLYCSVCKLSFFFEREFEAHNVSQSHIEQEQKINLNVTSGSALPDSPIAGRLNALNNSAIVQVVPRALLAPPQQSVFPQEVAISSRENISVSIPRSSLGPNGESYVMKDGKGHCIICNVSLTSQQLCNQHIEGAKHKKKMASMTASALPAQLLASGTSVRDQLSHAAGEQNLLLNLEMFSDKSLTCSLCKVSLSGLQNAVEHFASDRHKKEVELSNAAKRNLSMDERQTRVKEVWTAPLQNLTARSNQVEDNEGMSGQRLIQHPSSQFSNQQPSATVAEASLEIQDHWLSELSPFVELHPDQCFVDIHSSRQQGQKIKLSSKEGNENTSVSVDSTPQHSYSAAYSNTDISNNLKLNDNLATNLKEVCKTNKAISLPSVANPMWSMSDNDNETRTLLSRPHSAQENTFPINVSREEEPEGVPHYLSSATSSESNVNSEILRETLGHDDSYHFDGMTGYCNACDVSLTSPQLARQHINGQKHRKKVENWRYRQQALGAGIVADQVELAGAAERREFVRAENPLYHFNGSKGFCFVCDTELTSQQQAHQHISGKPHLRNVERKTRSQQGQIHPLYCNVCDKQFTGQESADQHFTSEKHSRKVALMSSASKNMRRLDDQSGLIEIDGVIWFFCDVCKKPLNTHVQLEIHKKSPGHLMELKRREENSQAQSLEIHTSLSSSNISYDVQRGSSPSTFLPQNPTDILTQNLKHLAFGQAPVVNTPSPNFGLSQNTPQPGSTLPPLGRAGGDNRNYTGESDLFTTSLDSNARRSFDRFYSIQTTDNNEGFCAKPTLRHSQSESYSLQSHPSRSASGTPICEMELVTTTPRPRAVQQNNRAERVGLRLDAISLEQQELADEDMDEDEKAEENRCNMLADQRYMNICDEEQVVQAAARGPLDTSPQPPVMPERSNKAGFKFCCLVCDKHMNTKKSYDSHLEGKTHLYHSSSVGAPQERELPKVKKSEIDEILEKAKRLTKTNPRPYQLDLFEKAMNMDSVVYLPTGAGKTLVAVLCIGLMLKENKNRPVIFVVDKTLLLIQQAKYIINELTETFNGEIKVGVVCGGLMPTSGLPLWKHDIIITTADFCINMLGRGQIQWRDFSLAVLDEVHHCIKEHPYKRLLQKYHLKLEESKRPKILGLTASPAARSSVEETVQMLKMLLKNLGGAKMAIVDDPLSIEDLGMYQSNTIIHIIHVPGTQQEKEFQERFLDYFLQCYEKLVGMSSSLSDNKNPPFIYMNSFIGKDERARRAIVDLLMKDSTILVDILQPVFNAVPKKSPDEISQPMLKMHVTEILMAYNSIPTRVNFQEVDDLLNPDKNKDLDAIREMGLPCDVIFAHAQTFNQVEESRHPPMMKKLIQVLQDKSFVDWEKEEAMALVLVRERKQAKQTSIWLRETDFVQRDKMHVRHLVGHGKGGQDKGMAIKDQKKILDNQKKYHILVATSIAEEGIDIRKLELVVSLNPPASVTALVQMRGRARKEGSHFVVLCKNAEDQQKLKDLQNQEKNMQEAAEVLSREQQ